MDTLIERKKRFTPRRIYGGAGVLFILVFVFYIVFYLCHDYVKSRYIFCISVSFTFIRLNRFSCIKKQLDLPLLYI